MTRPLLPRTSSSGSGFFFCGIRLLPVAALSASSKKPNSSDVKRMKSSAIRLRCTMPERGGVQERRDEVAIAADVDAVARDAAETERGGESVHVDRIARAGDRAGSERQLVYLAEHRVEPIDVAAKRRAVRQQEVRDQHGLRAPQVRV